MSFPLLASAFHAIYTVCCRRVLWTYLCKLTMQKLLFRRLHTYGLRRSRYLCCSLALGVLFWSIVHVCVGLTLLIGNAVLPWNLRSVVYVSFSVQREVQTGMTHPTLLEVATVDTTVHIGSMPGRAKGVGDGTLQRWGGISDFDGTRRRYYTDDGSFLRTVSHEGRNGTRPLGTQRLGTDARQKPAARPAPFQQPAAHPITSGDVNQDDLMSLRLRKQQLKRLSAQADTVVKLLVWVYGLLLVVRGTVGCLGVGLRDPPYVKALWCISIFWYLFNLTLIALLPTVLYFWSIRLAPNIMFCVYILFVCLPVLGWVHCELIFSYYRILDMGGKGNEYLSACDLEQQRCTAAETYPLLPVSGHQSSETVGSSSIA